jgi:DNA (cytosine-5)-methyltransferase 1
MTPQPGPILDLFAGAGGWEEGLRTLGMTALGVELDPSACETARAAGHERLEADVTQLDPHQFSPVWGLIGSPPCQAYSTAGKGLGRADRPLVIACAHALAAGNDSRTTRLSECRDERSLLTVEPLRFALALKPRWIALEQVPAVLELWTLFAALLSTHGYETAVGILSAERYGVPQTRKRAFLIASLDGQVCLPEPTHRSYKPRRRETPQDELALEPWVSMAEALGWAASEEVGFPRRNDTPSNRPSKSDTGTYRRRDRRPACKPALTLTEKTRSWTRVEIRRGGERINESFDPARAPAQTVTTRVNRWQAHGDLAWRNGNQPNAAVRSERAPAPTIHFGHRANQVEWVPSAYDARQRGARPRSTSQPAPTMLASGLAKGTPIWAAERPATTVACDRRVHPPGHKQNASDPPDRYEQRRGANAVRVTTTQAAVLQGFDPRYPWRGPRTRQFEQIGNAVPPPLALRVLEQAINPSKQDSRQSEQDKRRGRRGGAT